MMHGWSILESYRIVKIHRLFALYVIHSVATTVLHTLPWFESTKFCRHSRSHIQTSNPLVISEDLSKIYNARPLLAFRGGTNTRE
jgi:hypothetical protein